MAHSSFITSALLVAALGGCALGTQQTTRLDAPMLGVQQQTADAAEITKQAEALNRMANDLVRRSTIRGAATGAIVSCGLVVVSSSNGGKCAAAAAAAAALLGPGAARAHEEREVEGQPAQAKDLPRQGAPARTALPEHLLARRQALREPVDGLELRMVRHTKGSRIFCVA